MKIAVYCTGKMAEGLLPHLERNAEEIKIAYFVETKKREDSFHGYAVKSAMEMNPEDFSLLIIASEKYYEDILKYMMENLDFEKLKDKIVSPQKAFEWFGTRTYVCVDTPRGGIHLAAHNGDPVVAPTLYWGEIHSQQMIEDFFSETQKYCKFSGRANIFLDIGANIGTTSIYVKKVLAPELRVIAFEMGKENCNMLKVNCIINNVEDIKAEHVGISAHSGFLPYRYNVENPAGSRVVYGNAVAFTDKENVVQERVISIDEYLEANKISPEEIRCIWMDVERHEVEAIEGMQRLFSSRGKENAIPMLHEFIWDNYREVEKWDKYVKMMTQFYSHFIRMRDCPNATIWECTTSELNRFYDLLRMEQEESPVTLMDDLLFF